MGAKLQSLIDAAKRLSPAEQLELVSALFGSLQQSCELMRETADFWQPKSIEHFVEVQRPPIVQNVAELKAEFWPEDETAEELIEYVYEQRQEDRLKQ